MANAWKEQLTDSFEQAKTVGGSRWNKIYSILRETLPQIWAEVTSGAKEMGGIGTEVASVATETLREEGKVKALTLREQLGEQLQKFIEQFKATAAVKTDELKDQAGDWDVKLEARYGNNYKVARQGLDKVVELYKANQAQVATEAAGTVPTIEVPYQVVDEPVAHAGSTGQ
ncbi:hypothetical protein IQ266_02825 [filamentous cyanobacterium LEGE 11480]|uniref:Uncharacterized protein n=1 Tax=Romeriopsis navalis LEGE 11480 TaxID=2777977 RepID=A0A928VL92_9CYAN|nr:hypothetical protein [Romeriopsis navalis]MBE9028691.1 hypothetical protein [Romeriopsis navalis LEGE 11480]